ncbi:MAG TPA: PilZ domain-containing protein [Sphingomicrobium sp.]|jgi:hypothetical protein
MVLPKRHRGDRPRELRRRVLIPARIHSSARWTDACILNISSRGLLIQSSRLGAEGSLVELRRGDHVIVARVVWRDGTRAGLQSEDRVPVEEIMSQSASGNLRLVASEGAIIDRRQSRRAPQLDARLRGRALEFIGIIAILSVFAAAVWTMAQQALHRPLAQVEAALGSGG